jgi:hypothetical protein
MAVKIYKTISPGNLSTVVKGVRISFNASTMHTPGVYSTSNKELQAAIEADPYYGKEFKLVYSSVEDKPEAPAAEEAPAAPKAPGRPKGRAKAEPEVPEPSGNEQA